MKTNKANKNTARRIGGFALGLGLIFGAAACGGNSAESDANELLTEYGIDISDFEDIDFEAELEAWEGVTEDYLQDLEG